MPLSLFAFMVYVSERSEALIGTNPQSNEKTCVTEGTEVPLAFKPFIFSVFVPERSEALVRTVPEGHLKTCVAEGTEAPLVFRSFIFSAFVAERSEALSLLPQREASKVFLLPKALRRLWLLSFVILTLKVLKSFKQLMSLSVCEGSISTGES